MTWDAHGGNSRTSEPGQVTARPAAPGARPPRGARTEAPGRAGPPCRTAVPGSRGRRRPGCPAVPAHRPGRAAGARSGRAPAAGCSVRGTPAGANPLPHFSDL
ncbi:Hypothetical protein SCLAV_0651 [Streptomyces clavuligerus]|uniref:Uncharacterized protein n=1 Tax=Streptomyces clavuligerus TaxID=1901 RepID=E2PUA8_STRCL|nr:Hypothetical protein SCLAV_0651 [Streptomyces clavuligerus]